MAVPSGALRFNADSRKLEYYNGEAWWQIDSFAPDAATGGARGVWGGGFNGTSILNTIDYVTISTTGNATSFGTLSAIREYVGGVASNTRGVYGGGDQPSGTYLSTLEYITISSTGNATSFGSLTQARHFANGLSNQTRGVYIGGEQPAAQSTIDYIRSEEQHV